MSESAGVDSGVLPPRFRQRTWRLVVIDVLAAAVIALLTVSATFGTALGLSGGTTVVVWLGMSLRATALGVAAALYPVALSVGPRRSAVALGSALLGVTLDWAAPRFSDSY